MSRIGPDDPDDSPSSTDQSKRKRFVVSADTFLAGAVTGVLSRAILQPFDVLKIRLQLQAEHQSQAKYKSLRNAVHVIFREEGLRAFWRGHVSGQYLSVLYGSIHFGIYQTLWLRHQNEPHTKSKNAALDVAFGAVSAVPATIMSYPFDVVRTRVVGQSSGHGYNSTPDAFKQILSKEGATGLYKGIAPALYTVPLSAGLNYCIYNWLKPFYAPYLTKFDDHHIPYISNIATILFGGLAGSTTKTMTFPLDTIKKRMQVQGFEMSRAEMGVTPTYKGFTHCFFKILKEEGLARGLYKGWVPGITKAFPSGAIQFYLLETSLYYIVRLKKLHGDFFS